MAAVKDMVVGADTPKMPQVQAPEALPVVDETAVERQRKKVAATNAARAGVASTYNGYQGRDSDKLG